MKEMWMEALGKKLNRVINQYKYPPLNSNIVTPEICAEWRTILSGLPQNDESLKQLITQRLLKSTIEEIEDGDDHLIFSLSMLHKGERYLVQLQLKNLTWNIKSIQFVEQVKKSPLIWASWILLAFILILSASLLFGKWLHRSSEQAGVEETGQNEEAGSSLATWADDFTAHLEEIEAVAKANGYILISEKEFEKAVQDQVQAKGLQPSSQEGEAKGSPSKEEAASSGSAEPSSKPVKITIESGATTGEVVQLLAEHNLVRSEKEALQLLRNLKLEHRIRAGTYTIPGDATYMEIFNIITH